MLSRILKTERPSVRALSFRCGAAHATPEPGLKRGREAIPDPRAEVIANLQAEISRLQSEIPQQARRDYDSGFKAGQSATREALESEIQTAVERLAATVADVASTRAETIRRAEGDTVRLAMEIARRVLHRELSTDPAALEALARAALEKLQSQEIFRVRVHPGQEPVVRRCLDQIGRGLAVEVIPDPNQPRGGAVFETARGTLDASVETQLQEIERGLADHLGASL